MKKNLSFLAILFLSIMLGNAQTPTPLGSADFPQPGDSVNVIEYTLPPTQTFADSTSANDSLSLDRTLQKSLQAVNDHFMDDIAIGGNQTDTVPLIIYAQIPGVSSFHRVYNLPNAFTPGSSSFPAATVYTYLETADGPGYIYYKNDATGFYELGSYILPSGNPAMTITNIPAKPVATFPLDYNSPNNVTNLAINSTVSTINTNSVINVTVDAYGTLIVVTGSVSSPVYTVYNNYLRTVTTSVDNMDLGSGMNYFIESKFYNYYVPGMWDPIVVYSVAQIRSNIDPMYWSMAGQWEDEIEVSYNLPFAPSAIDENSSMFNLFPNPSDGQVNLDLQSFAGEQMFVDVYDMLGNRVFSTEANNGIISMDLSNQAAGTYIVSIRIGEKILKSKLQLI